MKVAQSYLTLCDPMGYTVHGILQDRILEWVAFLFSKGSPKPRDKTKVSHIAGRFFTVWATRKAQEYWNGNLSLLHGIFLTQESNRGHLLCRQILYQLSYHRSLPFKNHMPWRNLQMTWEGFFSPEYFPHLLCSNIESISSTLGSKMGILHPGK